MTKQKTKTELIKERQELDAQLAAVDSDEDAHRC